MTSTTFSTPAASSPHPSRTGSAARRMLGAFVAYLAEADRIQRERAAFAAMDDHLLRDIGLTRHDLLHGRRR